MSLLFGNLVQAFVVFTEAVMGARAGDADAAANIPQAAADFRRSAANNASYLVYIGAYLFLDMRSTPTLVPISLQVWECLSALMPTCSPGYIPERLMPSVSVNAISRQFSVKTSRGSITPAPARSRLVSRQTHVCFSQLLLSSSIYNGIRVDLVQQGISEKVAISLNFIAAFITGFILAYVRSWRLALALSSILPCIAIAGGVMNKFMSKYMQYVSRFLLLRLDSLIVRHQGIAETRR